MQPKIYQAHEHQLDETLIDSDALYIVQHLKEAGFEAYLVGGSVRDLLTHRIPKDFDVSTSARPEQIKRLFGRNCLLIGRRFRLAHLRFGHKIIEVSTFRTGDDEGDLIVHDNQWGSAEEDVLRRDFTINGLFYDPLQKIVIDYVNGWEDLKSGILHTIGDSKRRFRQDPVRMIRLLKFHARLNFEMSPDAYRALLECREEIVKSSPARILEEILRMLESGSSAAFFHELEKAGMLELLLPCLSYFLLSTNGARLYDYLKAADQLIIERPHRLVDRSVLVANLLYPILEQEVIRHAEKNKTVPHIGDVTLLTTSLIKAIMTTSFPHFPKRLGAMMGYILATQYRFTPMSGKRHHHPKVLQQKEFPLALDLFKIRTLLDSSLEPNYTTWKEMFKQHERPHQSHHHHHERRHHHRDHGHEQIDEEEREGGEDYEVVEAIEPPKKRRKYKRRFPRRETTRHGAHG